MICAGLKEYIGATPALTFEASTVIVHSKTSDVSMPNGECEGEEGADQFYDAITVESSSSSSEDESDNEVEPIKKVLHLFYSNASEP